MQSESLMESIVFFAVRWCRHGADRLHASRNRASLVMRCFLDCYRRTMESSARPNGDISALARVNAPDRCAPRPGRCPTTVHAIVAGGRCARVVTMASRRSKIRTMTDRRPLPDALKDVADRIADALATVLPGGTADVRARIASVVDSALARLDLVPREEYERQVATLARLEGELRRIEARLAALESAPTDRGPDAG
jgi:hypothetical protein